MPAAPTISRTRKIGLTVGILLLLVGIFTCLAIVSYFFTWQADQDFFLTTTPLGEFLAQDDKPVENWAGRLGAYVAHQLVFRGAGIASFALGIWITCLGLNIVYGKQVLPILKYLRWTAFAILITAPFLSFFWSESEFPFGGAWGNEAVLYLEGLLGKAGTGMVLIAIAAFILFVIMALDISPLFKRKKKKLQDPTADDIDNNGIASQQIEPGSTQITSEKEEEQKKTAEKTIQAIDLNEALGMGGREREKQKEKEKKKEREKIGERERERETESVIAARETDTEKERIVELVVAQDVESENQLELSVDADKPTFNTPSDDPEFSFEVISQTEEPTAPAIQNGAHISIEDNEPYAPELDLPHYKFPTLDLLEDRGQEAIALDKEELEKNKNQIIQTLRSFGIEIQRISATVGPTVTLYEIVPAEGVRISKIRNLEDDIALNLAALGIRIIAPIPGKGTIGIEVPNAKKQIVSMRTLLSSEKFVNSKMSLPIALGKKIDNENYIVDLATMPHLLVAGATGQGKSVGINAILVSLLYKKHPSQLKFVLVDPKKVELSIYRTIEKHFLAKLPNEEEAIITDTKKVIYTLNALCIEMDNRYELLKEAGARNIKEYNEKFIKRRLNPLNGHKYLPFIVLVVDEFADLIMTAGKEVEVPIARLAQLARAVGIHLIIATQRPSVNVITGTIKANFPARIAFKVSAKVDSRTILDTGGAEQLIGRGDMLVSHGSELLRLQCAFVDTHEVEQVAEFIGEQRGYPSAFELPEYEGDETDGGKNIDLTNRDKLFEECARAVVQTQNGSTSNLQRRFNLGYNRAGRIMDQLEAAGIVGPASGSKPREVLFHTESELEQFLNELL